MEFQADQVRLPRADRPICSETWNVLDGSAANQSPFPSPLHLQAHLDLQKVC